MQPGGSFNRSNCRDCQIAQNEVRTGDGYRDKESPKEQAAKRKDLGEHRNLRNQLASIIHDVERAT